MNRIKKINPQHYDILLTPNYTTNPSMELLLGDWLNENFNNYKIETVDNLSDALSISWEQPDIDWGRLVNIHIDSYDFLKKTITIYLNNLNIPIECKFKILNPMEAKEIFFNRVRNRNNRFRLSYDFNDVITIDIVNPYSLQINKIKNELILIPELRIKKIIKTNTHIKLIGYTFINTTYEIRLWTSLMYNYIKWLKLNNVIISDYNKINEIINLQNHIDTIFFY